MLRDDGGSLDLASFSVPSNQSNQALLQLTILNYVHNLTTHGLCQGSISLGFLHKYVHFHFRLFVSDDNILSAKKIQGSKLFNTIYFVTLSFVIMVSVLQEMNITESEPRDSLSVKPKIKDSLIFNHQLIYIRVAQIMYCPLKLKN